MYPSISIDNEETVSNLLDIFESNDKFSPTHWGNSEQIKVEYDRNEIIEKISEKSISEVFLHRDRTVKYTGSFKVNNMSPRSYLNFDFHKSMPKKMWPAFFELSDKIAGIIKPSFGVTHIFWPPIYPWSNDNDRNHIWMNLCSYPVPVKFLQNGPMGVGTRTYFSRHILEMFGKSLLKNATAVISELDWGGMSIDIIEKPWDADVSVLLDNWLKVMNYLGASDVIAIPSFDKSRMGVTFSPSPSWQNHLNR
jgi:hypothetical protein